MKQIIFFDGYCQICNGFVNFLLKRDPQETFQFASLQGVTAKRLLSAELTANPESVILWNQGQLLQRSDAVISILQQVGGIWWCARVLWIVPQGLRDFFYRLFARHRYDLARKRDQCRLPSLEERSRFLD